MDDSDDEEFEPLFDYTRVQPRAAPVHTRDDKPTGASPVQKKHRGSKTEVEKDQGKGKGNVKSAAAVVLSDDDEDWLAPPPMNVDYGSIREDSTLKALRLKKLELAAVAQSAEESMRATDELVTTLNPSFESSPESASKQPVPAPPERSMIVVNFQNKDGSKPGRVAMDDKFELIFKNYAKSVKLDVNTLVFLFDGDRITPTATPASLGMEEDDMIEVHIKSR